MTANKNAYALNAPVYVRYVKYVRSSIDCYCWDGVAGLVGWDGNVTDTDVNVNANASASAWTDASVDLGLTNANAILNSTDGCKW